MFPSIDTLSGHARISESMSEKKLTKTTGSYVRSYKHGNVPVSEILEHAFSLALIFVAVNGGAAHSSV